MITDIAAPVRNAARNPSGYVMACDLVSNDVVAVVVVVASSIMPLRRLGGSMLLRTEHDDDDDDDDDDDELRDKAVYSGQQLVNPSTIII